MRVISGSAKGRRLLAPSGVNTRPTADMVKESLFNIIAPQILDCCFLDLFSGSGAIGIEAISRGASHCVFVESDRAAKSIIIKNLTSTNLIDRSYIYALPVEKALYKMNEKAEKFDIIFLDPPYAIAGLGDLINKILTMDLIAQNGMLITEHSQKVLTDFDLIADFTLTKIKKYGSETAISFFERNGG